MIYLRWLQENKKHCFEDKIRQHTHTHAAQVAKKQPFGSLGEIFNLILSLSWHFMLIFMSQLGPASVAYRNQTHILPVMFLFSVIHTFRFPSTFLFMFMYIFMYAMHANPCEKTLYVYFYVYVHVYVYILSRTGKPIYISQDRHYIRS